LSPSNGLVDIKGISQPNLLGKATMAKTEPLESLDSCEPPLRSSSKSSLFFIRRDSGGNWVVRDQAGFCGGLFVNRSEAVRFAMRENEYHSRAVIMVPGILELTADFCPHDLAGRQQHRSVKVASHNDRKRTVCVDSIKKAQPIFGTGANFSAACVRM